MTNASPGYIEQFKQKARKWAQQVVELSNTPVTGPLAEKKASLLKWAKYIKNGIESVFGTIDELENVGLGIAFIPLVPVAVVAASLAAITKWTLDYQKFKQMVAEQKRLEDKGVDPVTASTIVAKKSKPLFNLDLKGPLGLLLLGGGAWWLFTRRKDYGNR